MDFTRKEYNITVKDRGIIEPQKMSTQELLNTLSRYNSRHKVKNNCKKLIKIAKIQNILKNELNQAEILQNRSTDELKSYC